MSVAAWEDRVRAGRVPPDAEVRFPLLTGEAFVPAASLDGYEDLRNDPTQRWSEAIASAPVPWMTVLLAGVMVRITALANLSPDGDWVLRGARSTPHILEAGEVWRWATMALVHQAPEHLAFNLLGFLFAGWHLERVLGARSLLTVFGLSAIIGAMASTFASPATLSIGASGGVFGVVAAAVALWIARPKALPPRIAAIFGPALAPYLVLGFIGGLSNARVDNAAHLGGLLTGVVLGLAVAPVQGGRPRPSPRVVAALSTGALALTGLIVVRGPTLVVLAPAGSAPTSDLGPTWTQVVGWEDDVSLDGKAASTSPATDARWSVASRTLARIGDLDDVGAAVFSDLAERDVVVRWSAGESRSFGGLDGRCWDGVIDEDALDLRVCVARRGVHAIRGLWQSPHAWSERLAPQRDQLFDAVTLPEDPDAVAARATADDVPIATQLRALEALVDDGALDEGLSRLDALPADDPRVARATLRLVARAGGRVPNAEARIDRALTVDSTSPAVLDAARALESLDEPDVADALVRLAWRINPWDTALTEALRARGGCTLRTPSGQPAAACPDAGPAPTRLTVAAAREDAASQREAR